MENLYQLADVGNPDSSPDLAMLLDTLDALEVELESLPSPGPLFARELSRSLAETLGVTANG